MTGTAPSSFSATGSSAADGGAAFGTLKAGKGKGPGRGGEAPTTGTEPAPNEPEPGDDSGHGRAATQIEGFTTSVTGNCNDLTIVINEMTVTTNDETEFQRGECTDLVPATTTTPTASSETSAPAATSFHLHIAAKMDAATGDLVATYVRIQGPKIGRGDEDDDDTETPPTTGTTPTK